MSETDEALMLAVKDGDVTKLATIFDRHHRALFEFFARMTGNRAAAEDLVQDVFFRILKYRQTFRNESSFKTWMFHIARNARIDYYRKHRLEDAMPENAIEDLRGESPFPDAELEQEQQTLMLECAMFRLAPEKREVLVLSRYQDLKYEQIADLMGCEVGTVKVRVHRALKELRNIFFKISNERLPCNVKKSENNLPIM